MPWRFGWKHEYFGGEAHITPRHDHVHVRFRGEVPVAELPKGLSMRRVFPDDGPELIETFEDGVEFCDWTDDMINTHARTNIIDYFAGKRGHPMKESRLVFEENTIVGAVLFCRREYGPLLDLLMVRPAFRRRGISSALVGKAIMKMRESGEGETLRSARHVANEGSALWHRSFGFEEERDLFLARMRRMFYTHEASRHEEGGAEHIRLEKLREKWRRRVEELEEVADREGFEAVTPALRYH